MLPDREPIVGGPTGSAADAISPPEDRTDSMPPSHRVTKLIDFCYGHRLLHYAGKCRHLHGHNGRLEVDLESPTLDPLGMVVDFGIVRDVIRAWIDDTLDHRMLLCRADPIVALLEAQGEPLFLMDENPTAENIAKLVYRHGVAAGLPIVEIRLWESPSSYASYRE